MRLLTVVVAAWAGALAVNRSLRRVDGDSMRPTLGPGELTLTVPLRGEPRVGDVVVADVPGVGPTVKRVVGTPGQHVATDEGHLVLDGTWHAEPYATRGDDGQHRWRPGDGWVLLGDNRGGSTDSRSFGRVPRGAITRRVLARVRAPRLLADAPVARPGPRHREAVRLLVLDPDDRLLLFHVPDAGGTGLVWMTPGGGRDVGEQVVHAAARELREEVGLPALSMEVLDVEVRRRAGAFAGAPIAHRDDWVAVRVGAGDVDDSGWTSYERDEITAVRWVTGDELEGLADDDLLVTPDLPALARTAREVLGPSRT